MADPKAPPKPSPEGHREYFKKVRGELLAKLGLPENTRPERVGQMLKLLAELEKIKGGGDG